MHSKKRTRDTLPEWLWFFLLLPMSLIVALLFRRRQMQQHPVPAAPRYVEPDSIPLNMGSAQWSGQKLAVAAPLAEELAAADTLPTDELLLEEHAEQPTDAASAPSADDDLKIIEGIGPVIAGLLRNNGIRTFQQLAEAPMQQITEILQRANLSRLADPASWPQQSQLAMEGKWEALTDLQNSLKAGRKRG